MTNLRQLQVMEHVLQVLTEKIGKYTSNGFAANLIGKAVMSLRDENECLNYILINETRYSEGINALSVSEEIISINSYQFFSAIKALIDTTIGRFDDNTNIHFVNELREELPDIFYSIDNLDILKKEAIKQEILVVDDTSNLMEFLKNGFQGISSEYTITGAMSGVECFDLLASEYAPNLILLNMSMADNKGQDIFSRLKKNPVWRDIPILMLSGNTDAFHQGCVDVYIQDFLTKSFTLLELKNKIDNVLHAKKSRGILHV